mgnify:CR=1 FL=1
MPRDNFNSDASRVSRDVFNRTVEAFELSHDGEQYDAPRLVGRLAKLQVNFDDLDYDARQVAVVSSIAQIDTNPEFGGYVAERHYDKISTDNPAFEFGGFYDQEAQ